MKNVMEATINYDNNLAPSLLGEYLKKFFNGDTTVVCIGTDKCIGDSLGPLVGSLVKEKDPDFPIYGTLDDPIHAVNLKDKILYLKTKYPNNFFIAIDACLGDEDTIGNIQVRHSPIYPGKGVGKKLPSVGHISIIGIVDSPKGHNAMSLHNVRLSFVMKIAKVISESLLIATK